MAKTQIPVDRLAETIVNSIKEYTEDVSAAIRVKVDEVADEAIRDIEIGAPKDTGEYAQSFVKKKQDTHSRTRRIIWSPKHYRRVHLLEFGHAKVNGGRVEGKVHIRPAADKAIQTLTEGVKNIIKNGG